MNWNRLEEFIGEELPLCVKKVLYVCGYNTAASIRSITAANISTIEDFINENEKKTMQELVCCHAEFYKNQNEFKLLPGHRALILELPKYLDSINEQRLNTTTPSLCHSLILRKMIETSENNADKSKNRHSYENIIRYFSTYLFLSCGRSCYEFLCRNLPLPSWRTVCKLYLVKIIMFI